MGGLIMGAGVLLAEHGDTLWYMENNNNAN